MTLVRTLFNGTDGVDITAAAIGAQQASTFAAGANTLKYSTAEGVNGTGAKITMVSAGAVNGLIRMPFNAANKTFALSLVLRTPVTTVATPLISFRDASARVWQIKWDNGAPGGRIVLIGSSNESGVVLGSTSVGLNGNTRYRFEVQGVNNSSAAGGTATCNIQIYDMSDTLLYSYNGLPSGTGTAIAYAEIGFAALAAAGNYDMGLDNLQMDDGRTTAIGKYAANTTVPTIVGGARQGVTPTGQTVNITATAAAYNGDTIASYSWTNLDYPGSAPTITNSSQQTASFVAAANVQGRYRFQVTATDTSGNVSSPATVTVNARGNAIAPLEVLSNTGFTLANTGALTDLNDATYGEGATGVLVVRLLPLVGSPTSFSLDLRNYVTAVAGSQSVALLDSDATTVRKDWGAISPGTSATDQFLTMSSAELAAGGAWDWDAMCLRFTAA